MPEQRNFANNAINTLITYAFLTETSKNIHKTTNIACPNIQKELS